MVPVWFIPSLIGGGIGWVSSDVFDFFGDEKDNRMFWVVAGAAGLYFAQKKGFLK